MPLLHMIQRYPYSPHGMSLEITKGRGVGIKSQNFKGKCNAKLEVLEGVRVELNLKAFPKKGMASSGENTISSA